MAKEFVIKHGLIVHGEITGSDIRIDDWNSVSASLSELSSNVGETVVTASIAGNIITFTKSDGTTFDTVVQEDTGSFFTSASVDYNRVTFTSGDGTISTLTIDTGSFEPDRQDTGSFFTSASVDLNTITFHYGDTTSGSLSVDTGSHFISNVELNPNATGSSLIFTGEGGAFNGAIDLSRAYQQGGGMTLNYSGSVLFNAASDWSGGSPNRKVSSTVTSMRDAGWNEWRFSDISRNFSSQYHNNNYNESIFDLITNVVNHTGQLIVRVYDDRNSAYEGFYMNSGSAFIRNNAGGAGDLALYLKHIGGRGFGATSGTPGNNTINNTNVSFTFTGTQLYESGSQSTSAFNNASVDSNILTLTRDDGSREILTIDTGSAVTTDISALNTFTGSIQTEVDALKAITGSLTTGSANLNVLTFTKEDGSTFDITVDTGSQVSPDTPSNSFQFNDGGSFGGSKLYYDSTLDRVGLNVSVPKATLHVVGQSNGTGSILIETDSATGNEPAYAKLDFRVADNDGGAYKKFSIIAENEGGSTSEADYGLGQLHFALSNDLTQTNAKIADSKLTLDHAGNVYMPAIDSGTTSNTIYYNTTTGELTYGAAPSGGGTVDTGSLLTTGSANLNVLTFTKGDGSTFDVTVDTGSQATPAGSTTELQFRDNGEFGATTGITYNSSDQILQLDATGLRIDGKSVPIQLTEGDTSSKQTVISYAQSTTSNAGFRVGNNDLGDTGRDIFVVAHGTTNWQSSNTTNIFELDQAGTLKLSSYGDGNNTGTATRYLAVDADGNLIEESIPTGGGGTVDTGSLLANSSANLNVLTFTKGDGSTFDVTIDTGSASGGGTVDTSSLLTNGSANLNVLTFTKGDGSTFDVTVDTGSQATPDTPSNSFQFNDGGSFGGSKLYYDSTLDRVGLNVSVPKATLHVVGQSNGTGSLLIETDSAGGAESGYAKLDFRVADNDGGAYKKFSIIAENEGGGTNEANYGLGQLHFALNNNLTQTNATIADSKLTLDHEGNVYMPGIDSGTTSNTIYYNTTTGELTYGAAPSGGGGGGSGIALTDLDVEIGPLSPSGSLSYDNTTGTFTFNPATISGGGTDTTIYSTNGTLSGNRTLTGAGNTLTFSGLSAIGLDADMTMLGGQIYLVESSNGSVLLTNDTKSDVLYFDSNTGEVTYGAAPSGGSGIALTDLDVEIGSLSPSGSLSYDNTTGTFTFNPATISGGGGSTSPGGSDTQVQYNNGGSFGGSAIYYNDTSSTVGINEAAATNRALSILGTTGITLKSTSTAASNRIQLINASSHANGVILGSTNGDDFHLQQYDSSTLETNLTISNTGETFLPRLASDATPSDIIYYDSTTGELTYGAAPSGGGGSTSPGGSTTQVQFNNAGSFGGDAGLVYDSANDRLGIGGIGTPVTTLHLAKGHTPIFLDGATASEDTQYIRIDPNGEGNNGIRIGAGYASGTGTSFKIGHHASGTGWTDKFELGGPDGELTLSGYSGTNLTSAAGTDYVLATNSAGAVFKVPITYSSTSRYGFGTTNPTAGKLQVEGNVSGVSIYASHDIVAYSDARSKVNVETISNALEKVNAVRGVTYNKVEDPEGMKYMGVIAQELLEHLPEVVHQGDEGNYSVAYGNVVGVLIEAVKELTAKVEDLESRLGK